ncbi:uncharacterized protein LOC106165927 [Lingula anatina]|uniref:Uncharacterized protein LOC106165927 n=1 Tax=Lingula anatina TaxID=7574 RepID=A0A1S3IPB3_LINAN|nr:uncharacterized protein LOC106165927 [Lingula anatina]|eukprot:XP_013399746.1 uncharacterized protein LOC106165927 [Lingula anatina]
MTRTTCWKLFCTAFGILEAAVYSFTLFGWPAFVYIFIEEKFYYSRCHFDPRVNASIDTVEHACTVLGNCTEEHDADHVKKCNEQEEMLNLVYTVAIICSASLPVLGYIYDHCGTVCVRILSIFLCAGGFFLMALAERGTEWLLFPGAAFHMMGGVQLDITDVQVAGLFPKLKATLICLVSGAADVSGFAPILLKMAYQTGVSYKTSMFTFAGIILVISSVNTITLPPRQDDDGNNIDIACCFKILKSQSATKEPSKPYTSTCTNAKYVPKANEKHKGHQALEQGWKNVAYIPDDVSTEPKCGIRSTGNVTPEVTSKVKPDGDVTREKNDGIIGHHDFNNGTSCQNKNNINHTQMQVDGIEQISCEIENSLSKENGESANNCFLHDTLLILKLPAFWVLMLWFLCQNTIIVTYQGSFYSMINYYGNNVKNKVSTYTDVYSWFQMGSLFWALLTGLMLDKLVSRATTDDKERCFVVPFFLTVLAGFIASIACIIPFIEMQFVAIMFHSMLKTGSYAVHMAYVAIA